MERLTKKEEWVDYAGFTNDKHNYWSDSNYCIEKLGQLEDIEEELGIDLITLFRAFKNGIYYKGKDHNTINFCKVKESIYVKLKDYGKTWWLEKPKEELENE